MTACFIVQGDEYKPERKRKRGRPPKAHTAGEAPHKKKSLPSSGSAPRPTTTRTSSPLSPSLQNGRPVSQKIAPAPKNRPKPAPPSFPKFGGHQTPGTPKPLFRYPPPSGAGAAPIVSPVVLLNSLQSAMQHKPVTTPATQPQPQPQSQPHPPSQPHPSPHAHPQSQPQSHPHPPSQPPSHQPQPIYQLHPQPQRPGGVEFVQENVPLLVHQHTAAQALALQTNNSRLISTLLLTHASLRKDLTRLQEDMRRKEKVLAELGEEVRSVRQAVQEHK